MVVAKENRLVSGELENVLVPYRKQRLLWI
jgi:hypothetical protein